MKTGDWIIKLVNFQSVITRPQPTDEGSVLPDLTFDRLSTHYASVIDFSGDCMADLVMMADKNGSRVL